MADLMKASFAILYDAKGMVLMGRRADSKKFSFVGGGRDGTETASECVSREVHEEVGLMISPKAYVPVKKVVIDKVDGGGKIELSVFAVEVPRFSTPRHELDVDGEFTETAFLPEWIIKEDNFPCHIPKSQCIITDLIDYHGDWRTLGEDRGAASLDSVPKKLSLKERLILQKNLASLFKGIKSARGLREKLALQKEVATTLGKLGVAKKEKAAPMSVAPTDESGSSLDSAKERVEKMVSTPLSSLSVGHTEFLTPDLISSIEEMANNGSETALSIMDSIEAHKKVVDGEIDRIANIRPTFDSVTLDGVAEDEFKSTLKTALDPSTPAGDADKKKKLTAFERLIAMVKRNKTLMNLIE